MAKTKNRTKFIQEMIDRANETFRDFNVKDRYKSDLFMMMNQLLLDKDMYRGYNFYKKTTEGFNPLTGEITYDCPEHLVLAGSADPDKYDCIQLY